MRLLWVGEWPGCRAAFTGSSASRCCFSAWLSAGVPRPATLSWSNVLLPAQLQIHGRSGVHAAGGGRGKWPLGLTCDFFSSAMSVQCSTGRLRNVGCCLETGRGA